MSDKKKHLPPIRLYVNRMDANHIGEFVLAYSERKNKTDICYENKVTYKALKAENKAQALQEKESK